MSLKATPTYNLAATSPILAKEWHPTKNAKRTPKDITPGSGKKVWWKCKRGHEWVAAVNKRANGRGCPYCAHKIPDNKNSLLIKFPKIAKEWCNSKNGSLKPKDVLPYSNKKVWWRCKKGHEWKAVIALRVKNHSCPYCNSLLMKNPTLAREWHPSKNGKLTPDKVSLGSGRKVWWKCKKGHEWQAQISNRNYFKSNCPDCSKKRASINYCLGTTNPQVSKEWSNKNKKFTPWQITPYSNRKVWWKCKKGHEWEATVSARTQRGTGCPYCSNKAINKENCLATINPYLGKEWHHEKNKPLTPWQVGAGSSKIVWWKCKRGHEWRASIDNRYRGRGCPFCHSKTSEPEIRLYSELKSIFSDVKHRAKIHGLECDIFIPNLSIAIEYDGCYWHKKRAKHDERKTKQLLEYGIYLIRVREKGLNKIGKYDILWNPTSISDFRLIRGTLNSILKIRTIDKKTNKKINEYLTRERLQNSEEYNRLLSVLSLPPPGSSLFAENKKIIKEWHPSKNGLLNPKEIYSNSHLKVWWKCNKGHEWEASIASRNKGSGCPICANLAVHTDNCLATLHPGLVGEWHPFKNKLTPRDVVSGSEKKVWWKCKKGHEWEATVSARTQRGTGCPFCAGQKASLEKSLIRKNITLAREWHPSKNGKLTPDKVLPGSNRKVWWKCKKGHEWQASVNSRNRGNNCPYCSRRKVGRDNNLKSCNPILAKEWHPLKNGKLMPSTVAVSSHKKVWWKCKRGHEWKAMISNRNKGRGCPYCTNQVTIYKRYNL